MQALITATENTPAKLLAILTGLQLLLFGLQEHGEVRRAQQQSTLQLCFCLSCYSPKGPCVPAQNPWMSSPQLLHSNHAHTEVVGNRSCSQSQQESTGSTETLSTTHGERGTTPSIAVFTARADITLKT